MVQLQKKEIALPKQESEKTKQVQKRAVASHNKASRTYVVSQGPIFLNEEKKRAGKIPRVDTKHIRKKKKMAKAEIVKKELKKPGNVI